MTGPESEIVNEASRERSKGDHGEAGAHLVPLRSHWTSKAEFNARISRGRADPALTELLIRLGGDTGELRPVG